MTTLTRWNPIRETFADRRRFFNEAMNSFEQRAGLAAPAMDIIDHDDHIEVFVNLPGINPEAIEVEVNDGLLTIAANVNTEESHENGRYTYRERYQGSYQRSLRLPKTVDGQNTAASFDNGVLTLTLNKKPEAQPVRIPVNRLESGASSN